MRTIQDANLTKSVNLPAAGASAVTGVIHLGTGPHTEILEGKITVPDVGDLADDKDLTVILEECDTEDGNFTTVAAVAAQVLTGAGGVGADGVEFSFRFPPDIKSFIRAKATLEAVGGDITDDELTLAVLA